MNRSTDRYGMVLVPYFFFPTSTFYVMKILCHIAVSTWRLEFMYHLIVHHWWVSHLWTVGHWSQSWDKVWSSWKKSHSRIHATSSVTCHLAPAIHIHIHASLVQRLYLMLATQWHQIRIMCSVNVPTRNMYVGIARLLCNAPTAGWWR